jgi:hypothetical protein
MPSRFLGAMLYLHTAEKQKEDGFKRIGNP